MIIPLLGAHMSIQGGFANALIAGNTLGCTAIQIFVHSNRQWRIKTPEEEAYATFLATQKQTSIRLVIAHASYLLNLGTKKADVRKKSIAMLSTELTICARLGIPSLVLHPGTATDTTQAEALTLVSEGLDAALETAEGATKILIENTAGQGKALGSSFEELAEIRARTHHKKRLAFCFDTCHAFAAGYDFRTPKTYTALCQKIETLLGIEHIQAFHMNDSKKGLGSHVDRHEDIGKGELGLEAFALILRDSRFKKVPKILETPKGDQPLADDARNLAALKKLLD